MDFNRVQQAYGREHKLPLEKMVRFHLYSPLD